MQKRLTEQGLRFLEEGQFDKAGQILSLLIKSFPDNADAHHMLGIIELEKGDFESAYILVNTAIDLVQDNPMFYNTLGNIELHRKNINQSEKAFLKAIQLAPDKIEYKYNLAHFYLTQSKYEKAIDYYYAILHSNPTHYLSIRGITVCYLFSGETEIALEHANEWVSEYSNYDEVYYYQGLCKYAMNDITGALAAYDKGLELSSTNQDIITAIGACYRALGNFSIAETYLHKSLSLDSNNPTAIYHLACIKLDNGELDSAYDLFKNAINLNSSYAEPICGLGCIELVNGNEGAALELFVRAEKTEPSNIRSRLLAATTLLRLQRFTEGWPAFNKFVSYTAALKNIPLWAGNKLDKDQTLLVWSATKHENLIYQILFGSMLVDPALKDNKVVLQCDMQLAAIFQESFAQFKIVYGLDLNTVSNSNYGITQQINISALGQYCRPTAHSFAKTKAAYLKAKADRKEYYLKKYRQLFPKKKLVGISWKSLSSYNAVEHIKSSHLSAWIDVLSNQDYQFISLQSGNLSHEIQSINSLLPNNIYVDPELDQQQDLSELCAQISALDLVISVDNHVLHLAGALGLNAYALLSVQAEWYWFKDKDKSAFYPNTHLIRQTIANNWDIPLQQLAKIL